MINTSYMYYLSYISIIIIVQAGSSDGFPWNLHQLISNTLTWSIHIKYIYIPRVSFGVGKRVQCKILGQTMISSIAELAGCDQCINILLGRGLCCSSIWECTLELRCLSSDIFRFPSYIHVSWPAFRSVPIANTSESQLQSCSCKSVDILRSQIAIGF